MYKELTTCDVCGEDATKKGCAAVEIVINQGAAPRDRTLRRRRSSGAWAALDFCAKCFKRSGLKKHVMKQVGRYKRLRLRRHRR